MEQFDIKKEVFASDSFNAKDYLNSLFANTNTNNQPSDILSFKLKIIQREFSNIIDLNSNNVLKSSKTIEKDLGNVNIINQSILNKLNVITANSTPVFNSEIANNYAKANDNLNEALKLLN